MTPVDAELRAMRDVADDALRLHAEQGGIVFTAAVVQGAKTIVTARNEVAETGDPSRHAEIVALARAARKLGTRDLSGCTLVASCQPCEMCLSAMRWAGVDRLIFGARQEDSAAGFFQFPGLSIADYHAACEGVFGYLGGVEEDRLRKIYTQGGGS
ncbi:nucleoside deaminase [Salipiger sp. IMCC34102]|uniref:nucleoside deaminase n=1 Tax=Salipiger sp. IMCC34102 TaxID=2510647 RepID=UPI00101C47D0|nr:nucleoside deaminase [Salipiger sp. IMCC34102]RYH03886.1 nucleoside deaminase [Salipiger sp. IMCC34102]